MSDPKPATFTCPHCNGSMIYQVSAKASQSGATELDISYDHVATRALGQSINPPVARVKTVHRDSTGRISHITEQAATVESETSSSTSFGFK